LFFWGGFKKKQGKTEKKAPRFVHSGARGVGLGLVLLGLVLPEGGEFPGTTLEGSRVGELCTGGLPVGLVLSPVKII
jgi:hypothetical protein